MASRTRAGYFFVRRRELRFLGKLLKWSRMFVSLTPGGVNIYQRWPGDVDIAISVPGSSVRELVCMKRPHTRDAAHGDRNRRSSFRHGLDMAHHEFEIVTDKERIFFKLDPRALQTPSNELALWTRKLQLLARGFDAQVTLLEA